ncbi:MAG: DUF86 domain-containing protein [Aquificota bacterium]|nr:MAG: DUF86 domain-containing protein [Aquificota bacterium]
MRKRNKIILQLAQEMQDALKDLQTINNRINSLTDLEKDPLILRAARDAAFVAIQSAMDMGNRIIATEGYRKPETYRDIFSVLEEKGLLTPELSNKLKDLAGFRNALVHFYWKFQRERLLKFLKEDYVVLEKFLKKVLE